MDRFYEQAFDMLTSPAGGGGVRPAAASRTGVREKYGRGHRGACYLVGRKLIEAGVRFVTVDVRWPLTPETPGGFNLNWDHHDLIYAKGSCGTVRDKAGGEGRYGIGHWVMMGSDRPGVRRPDRGPATSAACWPKRWSASSPSSAGRRSSTNSGAATTGPMPIPSPSPAPACPAVR